MLKLKETDRVKSLLFATSYIGFFKYSIDSRKNSTLITVQFFFFFLLLLNLTKINKYQIRDTEKQNGSLSYGFNLTDTALLSLSHCLVAESPKCLAGHAIAKKKVNKENVCIVFFISCFEMNVKSEANLMYTRT
jgi:hypothetical protein